MTNPASEVTAVVKEWEARCPFCGRDPFHRVDNGCGMEAVAVNCCELGCFLYGKADETTITREEVLAIVATLTEQAKRIAKLEVVARAYSDCEDVQKARALRAEVERLTGLLEEARMERDLALAHDTQPYPTAEAYEKVCAARTAWQARTEAAEAALETARGALWRFRYAYEWWSSDSFDWSEEAKKRFLWAASFATADVGAMSANETAEIGAQYLASGFDGLAALPSPTPAQKGERK